jgi:uncharacterized repeat protein (TIGR01451 family)
MRTKNPYFRALFFSFLLVATIIPFSAKAAVFNVTTGEELRLALETAGMNGEDDLINIAAGVYQTGGDTFAYDPDATEDFSLEISGEGAGLTILDGGGIDQVMSLDASVVTTDENTDIDVNSITFRNGSTTEDGGGLYITAGDGFLEVADPVLTVEDCEFQGNDAIDDGGGLFINGQFIVVSGNRFTGNSSDEGGGASLGGGGLEITLTNNIFNNNQALAEGGGASVGGGGLLAVVNGNTFTDNEADEGGGLEIGGGSAIISMNANTFINNSSTLDGAGLYAVGGGLIALLTNNIFVGNDTQSDGGGAQLRGGGMTADLVNNTFTLNSAAGVGGGLQVELLDNASVLNLYNNIVYNNTGGDIYVNDDFDGDLAGSAVLLMNNDYSDFMSLCEETEGCVPDITETDNIDADPDFVNAVAGNVGIFEDSPVINEGDGAAPDLPLTDFLGTPRVIGPAPDIGAIEFTGSPATLNVSIVKTSDVNSVPAGEEVVIEYTIVVESDGDFNAQNVAVSDDLPNGASLVSASEDCIEPVAGEVLCEIGTFESGDDRTFTVVISVTPQGADLINDAIASFLGGESYEFVVINVTGGGGGGGGCTVAPAGSTGALPLYLFIPVFIVISIFWRRAKRG